MPSGIYKRSKIHNKRVSDALKGISHKAGCKCAFCGSLSGKRNAMFGKFGAKHPAFGLTGKLSSNWVSGVPKNYTTIHRRINNLFGCADHCENVKCKGKSKQFDWSNKNHKYSSLKRRAWQQLCRTCHNQYDIAHNNRKPIHQLF